MTWCTTFLRDDDATAAVEYAVMLALILITAITAVSAFGSNSGGLWDNIGTQLDESMR